MAGGGRIAGITIEIGGDTQKLNKALSGVNKDLNSTSRELRDVNKLLKLDPTNVTLLEQKQKMLAKQIDTTKQKLDQLKTAEEQAREALEKGEIAQEEFDALQREIIETENSLKALENEAGKLGQSFSKVEELGGKFQEVGGRIEDVGKKVMPLSAAVAGVGAASVAAFSEMDKGYDIVITKTGATGEALEGLKDSVNTVFSDLPVTAEEAGTAVGEVNTRFGMTGDILSSVSEEFLKFAKINGTDVNNAIDNTDAVMTKFNIDASEMDNVLGALTKAGQDTGISVDTLYSSLLNNGDVLKEMNLNFYESVDLLAQFESNGINASTGIAALRKAQQNAAKDGKSLDKALKDTISSIKNAETETDALKIATELFGKKGAAEMTQAIREGRLSIEDLSGSMDDYSSVVSDTFESTQDPIDKAKVAFNNIKLAGAELGATLMNMLAPHVEKIVTKIQELVQWFTQLDPTVKTIIVTVGLIVAALGPVLVAVGKAIVLVGQVMTFLPKIQTGIAAVTAVLGGISAPMIGLVAVIAAVIAAGVALYKNWDVVKQKAGELKDKVVEKVTKLRDDFIKKFEEIKTKVTEKVKSIKDNAVQKFEDMKSKVSEKVGSIKTDVQQKFEDIKSKAVEKVESMKNKITEKFGDIKDKIKDKLDAAKETVTDIIDKIKSKFNITLPVPKLKLPHLSISGKLSLNPPSVPSFSVKWYKKAYNNPILFNDPTVLATAAGYKGFGDGNGGELVIGKDTMMNWFSSAMNSMMGGRMDAIYSALERMMPYIEAGTSLYLDKNTLIGATAPGMNQALGKLAARGGRGL